MPDSQAIIAKLLKIAEPVCSDNSLELVDIDYVRAGAGWVVRVYIDHAVPAAGGVDFSDCEHLSRELSAVLDVEDPIPHTYSLEVSSPGLDRPLRTAAHFRRFAGDDAKVTLRQGLDGRRRFKGRLVAVEPDAEAPAQDSDVFVTMEVDGVEFRLPLADIASAKLVPDWDGVMKGRART